MWDELLQPDYGVDDSPLDKTRINQVILYFNEEDTKELKTLAKESIKRHWPDDFQTQGNISDLFLKLLRNENDSNKTQHD